MALSGLWQAYEGRIVLVGNGPSLDNTPLKKGHSFAMNGIRAIYDRTEWRPSFYVNGLTHRTPQDWWEDLMVHIHMGIPCFVREQWRNDLPKLHNLYFVDAITDGRLENVRCDMPFNAYGSTLLLASQLAHFMGFDEMVLVGCDGTYRQYDEKDINHFRGYDNFVGSLDTDRADKTQSKMIQAQHILKRLSELRGFKVYDATVGGGLGIHEHTDY